MFSPAKNTMQLFHVAQHDILGVAHYIMEAFYVIGALMMAPG